MRTRLKKIMAHAYKRDLTGSGFPNPVAAKPALAMAQSDRRCCACESIWPSRSWSDSTRSCSKQRGSPEDATWGPNMDWPEERWKICAPNAARSTRCVQAARAGQVLKSPSAAGPRRQFMATELYGSQCRGHQSGNSNLGGVGVSSRSK